MDSMKFSGNFRVRAVYYMSNLTGEPQDFHLAFGTYSQFYRRRDTGEPQGASNLTWSFAAFANAAVGHSGSAFSN
jgi:hypothetical protein